MRAKGMGANVIVTEVDPIRALEAKMDGFEVMPIKAAAEVGEIFVTVTGNKHVIDASVLEIMKNGAIVANSGHFDNEINVDYLNKISESSFEIRPNVKEYHLKNGKTIYLLAEGRLVNLSAAEGHPSEVMDMSFANQALVAEWLTHEKNIEKLEKQVYPVPREIDEKIAMHKLKSMGVEIDTLTKEQEEYMESWKEGT
jgi:adenosylhomocysteinase